MTARPSELPRRGRPPVPAPDHGTGADPAVPAVATSAGRQLPPPAVPSSSTATVTLNVRISPECEAKLLAAMSALSIKAKRAAVEHAIDLLYQSSTA